MIILISGKKRSGKDYVAKIIENKLRKNYNVYLYHFADELKNLCSNLLDIDVDTLEKIKEKNETYTINVQTLKDNIRKYFDEKHVDVIYDDHLLKNKVIDNSNKINIRKLLQIIGTDIVRKMLGRSNHWIDIIKNKIVTQHSTQDVIIISDWRFVDEFLQLQKIDHKIFTIRVYNQDIDTDQHISETELDNFVFDYGIDNTFRGNLMLMLQIDIMLNDMVRKL